MTAIAAEMINAARQSCADLRSEISAVRWQGSGIRFDFRGVGHTAELRGRNADLVIMGNDCETDRAVALRCLLDGHAQPHA